MNKPQKKKAARAASANLTTQDGTLVGQQSYVEIPESAIMIAAISNIPDSKLQDRCMNIIEDNAKHGRLLMDKAQERAEGRADTMCKASIDRTDRGHSLLLAAVYVLMGAVIVGVFCGYTWKELIPLLGLAILFTIGAVVPRALNSLCKRSENQKAK